MIKSSSFPLTLQETAHWFTRCSDRDDSCNVPRWKVLLQPRPPSLHAHLHFKPNSHHLSLHVPHLLSTTLLLLDIRAPLIEGGFIDGMWTWRGTDYLPEVAVASVASEGKKHMYELSPALSSWHKKINLPCLAVYMLSCLPRMPVFTLGRSTIYEPWPTETRASHRREENDHTSVLWRRQLTRKRSEAGQRTNRATHVLASISGLSY